VAPQIAKHMATFERGTVVRVPFPYTDRDTRQHRPALVVSAGGLGDGERMLWVVMITSAANRIWPGDVPLIDDHQDVGLPVPSLVRTTKIATIESGFADRLGSLPSDMWTKVEAALRDHLGFV
jgi:mRNA interferase MazF